MLTVLNEFVSNAGKFLWSGRSPPVGWKFIGCDTVRRKIAGYFGRREDKIGRRFVSLKMNEIFQHRQRLMFGSVGEASANARPAAAVKVGAFTIEGGAREGFAQHAIDTLRIG